MSEIFTLKLLEHMTLQEIFKKKILKDEANTYHNIPWLFAYDFKLSRNLILKISDTGYTLEF